MATNPAPADPLPDALDRLRDALADVAFRLFGAIELLRAIRDLVQSTPLTPKPPTSEPPPAPTPPAAPTGLMATAVGPREVHLMWAAPAGPISGWRLERAVGDQTLWVPVTNDLPPTVLDAIDAGLPDDATFFYRIRCFLNDVTSDWSDVVTVTTPPEPVPPPPAPTN